MSFLKSFGWVIAVVMLVACSGCWDTEIVNPSRPSSARGWEKTEVGSISVKGEFVLNKGEATDNGHVGLKVTDIYPAKYHFLDAPDTQRSSATMRWGGRRISDKGLSTTAPGLSIERNAATIWRAGSPRKAIRRATSLRTTTTGPDVLATRM